MPAALLIAAFVLFPLLQVAIFSLQKYSIFEPPVFNGLDNYIRLFSDRKFLWACFNSFFFMLVTPVIMLLSLLLALMLRENSRKSKFFRAVYFLPVITPIVISGIIWRWIFSEDIGLLNYMLSFLGIDKIQWLTHYPVNMLSLMLLTLWRGTGYYMLIFLAALSSIPAEVEEAALLDGVSRFQKIFYILIPMLRHTLLLVFITSSTAAIKMFTELYVMIPGAPATNKTMVYFIYQQAFERFDFGYGSAAGIILFILTFGFSWMNMKLMREEK